MSAARSRRGPKYRHYGRFNPVAERVARDLGLQPGTVHQGIHGHTKWAERVALVITALRSLGHQAMAERLAAPILSALEADTPPPVTGAFICAVQRADLAEDCHEAAYTTATTPDERATARRAWIKALADGIAAERRLLAALEVEESVA